jgi:WD repeat-containing protein 23
VYDVHPFEIRQQRVLPTGPLAMTMRWHGARPAIAHQSGASAETLAAAGAGSQAQTAPSAPRCHHEASVVRTMESIRTGVRSTPYCAKKPRTVVKSSQSFIPNARVRKDILPRGSSRFYNVNFSQEGDLLVVGAQDEHISIIDTTTLTTKKDVIANDIAWAVTSIDVSPDGQFLIYSSMHDVIHLTNVHGPTALHDAMPLSAGSHRPFGVYQARFSAGGNEIIAGCSNKCIIVYDVERKRRVEKFAAHDDDINSVAFADMSFRSNILLSGSDDRFIKVWDRREPTSDDGLRSPSGVLAGHMEGITCVNSRGDGVYAVSNGKDQCAKVSD